MPGGTELPDERLQSQALADVIARMTGGVLRSIT
jgi:hypothetical protein